MVAMSISLKQPIFNWIWNSFHHYIGPLPYVFKVFHIQYNQLFFFVRVFERFSSQVLISVNIPPVWTSLDDTGGKEILDGKFLIDGKNALVTLNLP